MARLARCTFLVCVALATGHGAACTRSDATTVAFATTTSAPEGDADSCAPSAATDDASTTPPSQTIAGVARDAKHGPIVVQDDGRHVYVTGVSAWPKELEGRRVVVEGRLEQRHGPACVHDPEPCQGIVGDYWVFVVERYRAE